jgi:hypothetical protein
MRFTNWLKLQEGLQQADEMDDYRGMHTAPNRESGAPMNDLSNIYPEDIYTSNAVRYYGDGSPFDSGSISMIWAAKGRPNFSLKVYRAVPSVLNQADKIKDLYKQKAYIMKTGKTPSYVSTYMNVSKYYDYLNGELEKLNLQPVETQKIGINPGDWVTINRQYAVEHGQSNLQKRYRILTKTVKAKDLYTVGDSVHEWGYDPS